MKLVKFVFLPTAKVFRIEFMCDRFLQPVPGMVIENGIAFTFHHILLKIFFWNNSPPTGNGSFVHNE